LRLAGVAGRRHDNRTAQLFGGANGGGRYLLSDSVVWCPPPSLTLAFGGITRMKVRPDWVGEVHDATCRFVDIVFDSATGRLSIRCWRPVRRNSVWEELLVRFDGLTFPPTIDQAEKLPYYEMSTIYFDSNAKQVHICFHAGLSIHYPAGAPGFSFRGPTGQRRDRKEIFP